LRWGFRCARIRFALFPFRPRRGRDRRLADAPRSTVSRKLLDAHENERRWLARELHDDISQRLWLIHLSLGTLRDRESSLEECRHGIGKAMQHVSDLSTDIQRLSHRLHSSNLELLGLAAAAAGYCGEVGDQHNVHIELRAADIPRDVPPEIALSIFRVLQEAVHNAIKHSGSPRCEVVLNHDSNEIRLTVRDSGRGFDAAHALRGRGLGLTSMKERVALVDGELSIESQPGNGTTVHVRVPLPATMTSAQ
jgi:signal transduction histidine kinase